MGGGALQLADRLVGWDDVLILGEEAVNVYLRV